VWVSSGSGGLKNTKNTQRMQRFVLVWAIIAIHLAVDVSCTLESGGYNSVRDLEGDRSVLS
jgi:hypothetical protein